MLLKASKFFIYCAIASPLIVHRSFFFPFVAPKILFFRVAVELAVLTLSAAVLLGKISWQEMKTKMRSPLYITVVLFTAVFLIASLTATHPSFAFWSNFERGEGGWQMLHYFLFFTVITFLYTTKKEWCWLIGWHVLISALVGLYAVGQAYDWRWVLNPPESPISGSLGNPSYLGSYMLLSLFLALWIASQYIHKTRWFWLGIALFELSIFVVAKTRGSFAALGVGMLFIAFFWIMQHRNNKRAVLAGAGLIALIILGTTLAVGAIKGNAWKSFQPRLWTWETALTGIREKPFIGWGVEHFPVIFDAYYNPRHDGIQPWFDRAHNAFLEYATSGGILLLGAYISLFYMLYRALMKAPQSFSWSIIAALPAMYFTNNLVLFEILPLYLLLFLLMAFGNAYGNSFSASHEKQKNQNSSPGAQAHAALIPLTLIIAVSLYYTAYLPSKKSILLLAAMQTNNRTDEEIFMRHEQALASPGPVGQEEAVQNLFTFTANYFDYLKNNNLLEKVSQEKRKNIIDAITLWYEREKDNAIGVRTLYLYAAALLTEMDITGDRDYLARADALIAEGVKKAPTRLEFVRLELVRAALEKDKARYARAAEKGKKLRPDLPWEQKSL